MRAKLKSYVFSDSTVSTGTRSSTKVEWISATSARPNGHQPESSARCRAIVVPIHGLGEEPREIAMSRVRAPASPQSADRPAHAMRVQREPRTRVARYNTL